MAQILTWDVEYSPLEPPWSVVVCESRKTIEDYLTDRSIILLHPGRYFENRIYFVMTKLRFPQTAIAVVGLEDDGSEIMDCIPQDRIEEYIRRQIIRRVHIPDARSDILAAEKYLVQSACRKNVPLLMLFDMDGTVVRSDGFTYDAMRMGFEQIYREENIERDVPAYEELIPRLGLGMGSVYNHFLPEGSKNRENDLRNLVRKNIRGLLSQGAGELFPEVETTLFRLMNHGITLALVSNSPAEYFYSVVKRFQLGRFFKAILCLGERAGKTKSDMIREMQDRFAPRAKIMVGDRYIDVDSGNECDCYTVGCSYGFGLDGELEKADAKIERFDEILELDAVKRMIKS